MGTFIEKLRKRMSLLIIILAALLLELISAYQYYYTHDLLETELEMRAEGELMMKGARTKNALNMAELVLKDHLWDVQQNLAHPDSAYSTIRRLGSTSANIRGSALAFIPGYHAQTDSLFEVYARKTGSTVDVRQIGGPDHDYTQLEFYTRALATGKPTWVDPYPDDKGAKELVASYSLPVTDLRGKAAGVLGVDVSLDWLSDTLDSRHIYPSSFVILLTEQGELFLGPKADRVPWGTVEEMARLINDSTVSRTLSNSGRSNLIHATVGGKAGTIFYANLKGYPHWQVAVICYDNEVYGQLHKMRYKVSLFMLIGFLLVGYIVWRHIGSLSRLSKADRERERIGSELHVAQTIQMQMLPEVFPPYPDRDDLDIYGTLVPAREVGGDLFDFFLRDEKLFFCIGDVSGKGVPSALVMAVAHSQFRMASVHESTPARIVQTLNAASCEGNESNIFITLFVGVLDLPTGRLRYCNAGHDAPFLARANGAWQPLDVTPNIPIALFDDFHYTSQETDLSGGATLFLYTDGLTEAMNDRHQQMGIQRIAEGLESNRQATPRQLVEAMVGSVHRFVGNAEQSDDLTMLAIRYTPKAEVTILHDKVVLANDVKQVRQLNAFIKSVCDRLELPKAMAANIKLAVEEAVVNVMEYAYPTGIKGEVCVEALANGHRLKIVISDKGTPFDPTEAVRADTTLSAEDRPVGGLGILLVRELMDSINYERTDGRNVLTLRKEYSKPETKQP